MSTLTKVLIVLLSLAAIFLSGIMVTFVATQQNYKEAYTNKLGELKAAQSSLSSFDQLYNEKSFQMQELSKSHIAEKQALTAQISQLSFEKNTALEKLAALEAEKNTWTNTSKGFELTISNNAETLRLTQAQLDKTREEMIKTKDQLSKLESIQYDKYVQVEQLQAQLKNLKETKVALEKRIEALTIGNAMPPVETVTPVFSQAKPASDVPSSATLKGVITEIGKTLVGISLGSADGVSEGTVFHVFRGNEFICNLKVTSADVNKSAGVVEMEMTAPKIGDTVTTKY